MPRKNEFAELDAQIEADQQHTNEYARCLKQEVSRLPQFEQALKAYEQALTEIESLGVIKPLDLPQYVANSNIEWDYNMFAQSFLRRLRAIVEHLKELEVTSKEFDALLERRKQ